MAVIADPFGSYLETALGALVPHAGFGAMKRPGSDAVAAAPAPTRRSRPRPRPHGVQPDESHGTTGGYAYWKCRCELCREAWAIYAAERRLRQAGLIA